MVKQKSSPPTKKPTPGRPEDELKKRLAELDDAYHKQLQTLVTLVRASRLNVHKPRRP